MLARIDDDGSVRVSRDALVGLANRPFSLDDLDPLIHNGNIMFQRRSGVQEFEVYRLSELDPPPKLIDATVGIVHDTVAALRRKRRFSGIGDFELMGYDFAVDRRHRPFLVEVNRSPGFNLEQGMGVRIYPRMIRTLYQDLQETS